MISRRCVLLLALLVAATGAAHADTKVVQLSHQDAFSVMGQNQPAKDQQQVMWIGDGRMRMDQGDTTMIVRGDQQKMFLIDHQQQTFSALDLPLDISKFLPPGMGEQMLQMMKFEANVEATEEIRTIGDWQARRYNVTMKSPMVSIASTYWATNDVDIDLEQFYGLYEQIMSVQPGMKDLAEKLRSIEGFVIEQQSVTTMSMMGDTKVNMSQKTVSVEHADPPPGTYDTPADYTDKPFDFMAMMQQR